MISKSSALRVYKIDESTLKRYKVRSTKVPNPNAGSTSSSSLISQCKMNNAGSYGYGGGYGHSYNRSRDHTSMMTLFYEHQVKAAAAQYKLDQVRGTTLILI